MTKTTTLLTGLALCASTTAFAQYRYTAPDGSVTFSDQPPVAGASHVSVSDLPPSAPTLVAAAQLPYSLSQASSSFPVTLYTNSPCSPCDNARSYLKQRGIPFSEKTITTRDDVDALQRVSGVTSVPVVTIGSQKLNGFNEAGWSSLLDDAGYPKSSVLPRDYAYPQPTAASGKSASASDAAPAAAAPLPAAPSIPAAAEPPPASGNAPPGFKF